MGKVEEKKPEPTGFDKKMKYKKYISYFLTVLIILFLVWNISKNWDSIKETQWQFTASNTTLLLLSISAIYATNILSWHFVTRALGENVKLKDNFELWIISNASRLLPGGIWQYPGRVILLAKKGVSKKNGLVAVLIEALLTLSLGVVTFLLSLFYWQLPLISGAVKIGIFILLLSPLLVLFVTTKIGWNLLLSLVSKIKKGEYELTHVHFNKIWIAPLFFIFFLKFIAIGVSIFILLSIAAPLPLSSIPFVVGAYALSWIIGYLAIFAPGGIGVTELSLAGIMSIKFDFNLALVVAVSFRVILLASEFLLVAIALVSSKVHNHKSYNDD